MKNIFLILLAIFLCFGAVAEAGAQKNSQTKAKRNRRNQPDTPSKRYLAKNAAQPNSALTGSKPIIQAVTPVGDNNTNLQAVIDEKVEMPKSKLEKLADETLGGNMVVDVSANGNTVIKVGLADRAVSLIDFPANDPVYKIHPGNENFVTVGCFGREPNGKCLNSPTDAIVLRPGKDFHTLGTEESVATVITIQRVSGIVVTLLVVPVRKISDNTNYVAVRYQLNEVLATRRNSGLPINMLGDEKPSNVSSSNAPGAVTADNSDGGNSTSAPVVNASQTDTNNGAENADKTVSLDEILYNEIQIAAQTNSALKFSKPVYGISLARAIGSSSRTGDVTVEVIALRNTLPKPIRLVPEQPQLVIENRDSKETSVNIQAAPLLNVSTTVEADDVLLPGQIYYFAFAYESPILGVKQVLRVSFAQREASDAPASIIVSGVNR
ncbi:MAG TPA: hypothetical protein VK308_16915 [Pyrinomonadaceae bacterium]|nr:hypothetical protein [Pyrinomonadaceae bacterium]